MIDQGEPVQHNPWRQSLQEIPTLQRKEERVRKGGYYGYTVIASKLVRGQKTVFDVLSSIHRHDKILLSWILYWATELRIFVEALREANTSFQEILDNQIRINRVRRITFMLMMTFCGTTDALTQCCTSSVYTDLEWELAMAIPVFPHAFDRHANATVQLLRRPEDTHSNIIAVLSRCNLMVPWNANARNRLNKDRYWRTQDSMLPKQKHRALLHLGSSKCLLLRLLLGKMAWSRLNPNPLMLLSLLAMHSR